MMVGDSEIRTEVCRRWPLRELGLPFKAEGLPDCIGDESHWNGLPLLLRVEDAPVDACDVCRLGMLWTLDMS
jgi:hypothetical protein